uniref:Uncharacterized protein n=1 Tax=Brassica oleracea TaxID=3712 RepID=A0A3P6G8Z9_BRAOL|nr:unnamed protein product [Brassica oleracea]
MGVMGGFQLRKQTALVKGAVKNVLERSTHIQLLDGSKQELDEYSRHLILQSMHDMSMSALRCLVFAFADVPSDFATYDGSEDHPAHQQLLNPSNYSSIESNLTFVGFVGLRRCVKPLQTDVTQIEHRSARIMDTVQGGVLVNQLDQTEVFMSDHASLAACDNRPYRPIRSPRPYRTCCPLHRPTDAHNGAQS